MFRLLLGSFILLIGLGMSAAVSPLAAEELKLDQSPAQPGQWGYRPDADAVTDIDPPSFSWRPQKGIVAWEIECRRDSAAGEVAYGVESLEMNVHRPPRTFGPGKYLWRYRGSDGSGQPTDWSRRRAFSIPADAVQMPLPPRQELLARIPDQHPRLFVRPEDLPRLRELADGRLREEFQRLEARCEQLLARPPSTEEPPKYGPEVEYKSEEWRKIWWGNRTYTIAALDGAATLAFTRLINGNDAYGELAKRILLECARWDPVGSTGYRYNDEAGMPYAYHFARTYTFVHDLLSEQQREQCREVMRIRGEEMYRHLYPRHLWQPYSSHSNRAWHFLGELGIAMLDEVEGADDWVWFAVNVFHNVYPVWSDADGGWHEGFSYWNSYLSRFTWWADIMHSALRIDAYQKPFFSQMGYYPMYLLPPGKVGAGFGDLNAPRRSADARSLMNQIARQAGNGHWQWYVDQHGGAGEVSDYVDFIRAAVPPVPPQSPVDLPGSRLFAGTGQAMMNSTLLDANQSVQVLFKSSPFGTQSHGYEANNSFLLWAYGKRLLVRSGYRDIYGSDHHTQWMWSTRSVNNITVDGQGQLKHSPLAQGKIVDFQTTPQVDVVVGEAGEAYRKTDSAEPLLERFTRAIVFLKPDRIIIFDRLVAKDAATFQYHLHSPAKFQANDPSRIKLSIDDVQCDISFLAPTGLKLTQTDQYDPNPRPRVTLREWHLTASTEKPAEQMEFVTFYRPSQGTDAESPRIEFQQLEGGYLVEIQTDGQRATVLLPTDDSLPFRAGKLTTTGEILVQLEGQDGELQSVTARLSAD